MRYVTLLILTAVSLSACATQHTAPRFDRPSTSAIQTGVSTARKSVSHAKETAKAISTAPVITADPALKLQVDSLEIDLDQALSALDTTEGARKQLDEQLGTQTKRANSLADSYDKANLQITSLKASRHRWVKFLLISMAANVAAIGWIFRKPIMLLATGL